MSDYFAKYQEIKQQNPGSVLLFRVGDFYETFFEDAQTIARILGLTLIHRDKNSADPIPMAGFPYHALESYLRKLIAAGQRVAVCEPVDGEPVKGVVKREVTRVVLPAKRSKS